MVYTAQILVTTKLESPDLYISLNLNDKVQNALPRTLPISLT